MDLFSDTARVYRLFADEARDSACIREWALGVADDPEVIDWITQLPGIKRQANLVFAAARWHGVPAPGPYAALREALLADDGTIRDTILTRSTQTNEVGRLATLLPAFDLVARRSERPLALIEVGASAGLTLYADRYDYVWTSRDDGSVQELRGAGGPELICRVAGDFRAPTAYPIIAWRGGLDLNPLEVTDADAMAWLEYLVWPEHQARREQLHAAIEVARADPPHLVRGDLLTDLDPLLDEASEHGTPVVFHSAVLAYVEPEDRERFGEQTLERVAAGRCHWVSNEGKNVLPALVGPPVPQDHVTFVEAVDGRVVAWTHGHGRDMRWFG